MSASLQEIERLRKALDRAQKASAKAAMARLALPAGSSRARVTTANARWARAAEHRDRLARQLLIAEGLLGEGDF